MTKSTKPTAQSPPIIAPEHLKPLPASSIPALFFAIFALAAFAAATANSATVANLSLWVDTIGGTDALISFPVAIVWIGSGLVLGAVAAAQYRLGGKYRWRAGVAIASPLLVTALFTTLLAGTPANLTVLFPGTFTDASSAAIGSLAGYIS